MSGKKLAKSRPQKFFKKSKAGQKFTQDEGKLSLRALEPFVISGGENTERFYFQHISLLTKWKFCVKPKFFGNEASYYKVFPRIINEIIKENSDAKIYCVFDMDTINGGSAQNKKNHKKFIEQVTPYIKNQQVVLCPSMPCFEYWFYLHFDKSLRTFPDCKSVTESLEDHMGHFFKKGKESLLDIIKAKKPLINPNWVKLLCEDGKLDNAIKNAEINYNKIIAQKEIDKLSYSLVYLMFETKKKTATN